MIYFKKKFRSNVCITMIPCKFAKILHTHIILSLRGVQHRRPYIFRCYSNSSLFVYFPSNKAQLQAWKSRNSRNCLIMIAGRLSCRPENTRDILRKYYAGCTGLLPNFCLVFNRQQWIRPASLEYPQSVHEEQSVLLKPTVNKEWTLNDRK